MEGDIGGKKGGGGVTKTNVPLGVERPMQCLSVRIEETD